jgi:3-oxoacyl-[acyl-carrier protein] reductase
VSVAIVGGDPTLVAAIAGQLDGRGLPAVTITSGADSQAGRIRNLRCDTAAASAVEAGLAEAERLLGREPALIRIAIQPSQASPSELAASSPESWSAQVESPLREMVAFHQASQRFLASRGGKVLVVIPTVGLSGGPGFVPLATTAEADRSLVKAQARVSGGLGITVNCVAVASALLAGTDRDPDRGGLPKPALPTPDLGRIADVIVGLLGPEFDSITGQTIAVDGGRWMAP